MRKIMAVFVALLICLSLVTFSGQGRRDQVIEEINRNCDVPFALTLPEPMLQNTSEYARSQGFGGYILENDDVSFMIGGYPDCLDDYHIIKYQIKSSKYTFMGLQVGCSLDEADEVMDKNGYTISDKDTYWSRYTKNSVKVGISLSYDIVTAFHVSVEVTNKKNVSF